MASPIDPALDKYLKMAPCLITCTSAREAKSMRRRLYRQLQRRQYGKIRLTVNGNILKLARVAEPVITVEKLSDFG